MELQIHKLGRLGGKHFLEIYILFVYVAFHGICKRYKIERYISR